MFAHPSRSVRSSSTIKIRRRRGSPASDDGGVSGREDDIDMPTVFSRREESRSRHDRATRLT
jgi:hypothetical protein